MIPWIYFENEILYFDALLLYFIFFFWLIKHQIKKVLSQSDTHFLFHITLIIDGSFLDYFCVRSFLRNVFFFHFLQNNIEYFFYLVNQLKGLINWTKFDFNIWKWWLSKRIVPSLNNFAGVQQVVNEFVFLLFLINTFISLLLLFQSFIETLFINLLKTVCLFEIGYFRINYLLFIFLTLFWNNFHNLFIYSLDLPF